MAMSREKVETLLRELAEWLQFEGAEPVELVVCGGAAMALQQLNERTTSDVDVLGVWNSGTLEVVYVQDFPETVKLCIGKVEKNHPELSTLNKPWINLGPAELTRCGLPNGHNTRMKEVKFGDHLTIRLLNRKDLIALKLYAAADDLAPRQQIHFADLKLLNGTFEELDAALDWIRTLPRIDDLRPEIQNVLERLGHHDLANYV